MPCRPDDSFDIYLTGSIYSRVHPIVINARFNYLSWLIISLGSTNRPLPYSPQAKDPSSGPIKW